MRFPLYWLFMAVVLAPCATAQVPQCLFAPTRTTLPVPEGGFASLSEDVPDPCDPVPDSAWTRWEGKEFTLTVFADGPSGSGRFWNVTVGIQSARDEKPMRGFCLSTSTIGWRTLQKFENAPLDWVDDLNNDGNPEFILWESFSLAGEDSPSASGMVAWVYRADSSGNFIIDWGLSRSIAVRIAAAYREEISGGSPAMVLIRRRAALALDDFALGRCNPGGMTN